MTKPTGKPVGRPRCSRVSEENKKLMRTIYAERKWCESYTSIGAKFGVGRARARQIILGLDSNP